MELQYENEFEIFFPKDATWEEMKQFCRERDYVRNRSKYPSVIIDLFTSIQLKEEKCY